MLPIKAKMQLSRLWKNIRFFIFLPRSLLIMRDTIRDTNDNIRSLNATVKSKTDDGGIIDYNWIKFSCSRMNAAQANMDSINHRINDVNHLYVSLQNQLFMARKTAESEAKALPAPKPKRGAKKTTRKRAAKKR